MNRFILAALLLTASLATTAESRATAIEDLRSADLNALLDEVIPKQLLRGLFDQTLATLQEYVEVETVLPPNESSRPRSGEFRLKLFPQGKSHSQEHVTAEGLFRLSPDADQQEFTLRFKSSKRPERSPPPPRDVL